MQGSINKSNFTTFKNGAGLIDVNNPPDKIVKNTNSYPKNLNEMISNKLNQTSASTASLSRRNSAGFVGSAGSNGALNNGSSNSTRSPSEKSNAESTAKVIEPYNRNNLNKAISMMATNNTITEPIQLFKKINELANNSKQQVKSPSSQQRTSTNSMAENKKRISLLIARKN